MPVDVHKHWELEQTLDQGIIATFKVYYKRRIFSHILTNLEKKHEMSVKGCWNQYTIL
jgi:hypothetical protein